MKLVKAKGFDRWLYEQRVLESEYMTDELNDFLERLSNRDGFVVMMEVSEAIGDAVNKARWEAYCKGWADARELETFAPRPEDVFPKKEG